MGLKSKRVKKRRTIADHRKGIRTEQPKVAKDVDNLVDKYLKSPDYKAFKKRFAR